MRPFLDQIWRCSGLAMNRQEAKIFVGGLNWSTSEEKLRSYFENFGSVQEAFVSYDRHTGRPRGFGFVVFEDPLVADKVVSIQHTIDRREVEAKKAVPKDDQPTMRYGGVQQTQRTRKIFVGGLAPSVDELAFRKYFEQYGSVEDAVVMYDHDNKRPRGFGFISFYSEEAVDLVLASGVWKTLHDKPIEIKRAVPRDQMPLGAPTPAGPRPGRSWSEASRGIPSGRGMAFGLQGQPLLSQVYGGLRSPYDAYATQQAVPGYGDLGSSLNQTSLGLSSLGHLSGLLNQQQQQDVGGSPQLPHSLPNSFQHVHQHQHQIPGSMPGSLPNQSGLPDSPHVPQHFGQIPYQMPPQPPQYPGQQVTSLAAAPPSQLMPESTAAALASLGLGSDFGSRTSGLFNNLTTEHSASSFGALDLDRRMAATMGGMSNDTTFTHPFETASPHSSPQSSGHSASQPDSASHRQLGSSHDAPFSVLGSTTPPPGAMMPPYTSSPQAMQSPFADSAQSSGTVNSPKTPEASQLLNDQLDLLSLQDKMFVSSYGKQRPEVSEV
ncbi:TPA: hypothetical protein ACH3X1_000380 [Trebouxia sp. C0004]